MSDFSEYEKQVQRTFEIMRQNIKELTESNAKLAEGQSLKYTPAATPATTPEVEPWTPLSPQELYVECQANTPVWKRHIAEVAKQWKN